ncbi:MAG: hypothetical protein ABEH88_12490 [Halobacteriales archaeon]
MLEPVRRPEHTGENRCWPCTALNVLIAVVAGVILSARNRLLGLVAFGISVLVITLRGYLIPGTPRIAPRLVEPLPVDFGHTDRKPAGSIGDGTTQTDGSRKATHEEENGQLTEPDDADPEQLLGALVDAGVLLPEGDDLRLEETFREGWCERMRGLRERSTAELARRVARAAPDDVAGYAEGDHVLLEGNRDVWLRPAVAIAETAAAETLADRDLPPELEPAAAGPLRMFTPACPVCAGDPHETTVQNCCGGPGSIYSNPERPVIACRECERVLFEFRE